jgi:hypothetical protein
MNRRAELPEIKQLKGKYCPAFFVIGIRQRLSGLIVQRIDGR